MGKETPTFGEGATPWTAGIYREGEEFCNNFGVKKAINLQYVTPWYLLYLEATAYVLVEIGVDQFW